ncbi:hypothetical protein GCM10010486_87910 [Nonomuraea roseoviolacea subsp. carminata]
MTTARTARRLAGERAGAASAGAARAGEGTGVPFLKSVRDATLCASHKWCVTHMNVEHEEPDVKQKRAPVRGRTPGPALSASGALSRQAVMPSGGDQATSNRSRSMTFAHAATKSVTNFSFASSLA